MTDRYWAVVPAAGAGSRMASKVPKQYLPLQGRMVIELTLERLLAHDKIEAVYVVLSSTDEWWSSTAYADHASVVTVPGGAERCHSVRNALQRLQDVAQQQDWVLVHDAARPCLHPDDLDRLIWALSDDPVGGLLGAPVYDTMKQVNRQNRVAATLPRDRLWRAFTPQMFRLGLLYSALTAALETDQLVTDDASAIELAGYSPLLIEGRADNIKITRPEDLALAEIYLAR